jgi:hypothetical protein
MDMQHSNELQNWSATVRKVDSSLHAAFARHEREAARKQPFWKRATRQNDMAVSPEGKPAFQGSIV